MKREGNSPTASRKLCQYDFELSSHFPKGQEDVHISVIYMISLLTLAAPNSSSAHISSNFLMA